MSDEKVASEMNAATEATADKEAAAKATTTVAAATAADVSAKDDSRAQVKPATTVATGAAAKEEVVEAYWKDDWRDRIAGTADKRNPARKDLERYADPAALYNSHRELRSWRDQGGYFKPLTDKSTPEEVALYRRTMDVPETPEGYFDKIKLSDGAVIGDADKPLVESFAKAVHGVNAPPSVVNATLDWYYKNQEEQAAQLDAADERNRSEAVKELKTDWGAQYDRNVNAIATLFSNAPDGLLDSLLMGRTADGRLIGDDPRIVRLMVGWAREINPMATLVDGRSGDPSTRLEEIRKMMVSDPDKYWSAAVQAEEQQLISAQLIMKNRGQKAA